ncbi:MAG: VCBS repeat-containing protein [Phycisphaerales bacterium]
MGASDAVIDRKLVFLNRAAPDGSPHFEPVESTGLPEVGKGDVLVFADLDNDGFADAILGRNNDVHADKYEAPPEGTPQVSCWMPGHGDGTFGAFHEFPVDARTTSAIAIADADLDGRLDVYLANWYVHYGEGYEGYPNDLLLQTSPGVFVRAPLPTDDVPFDDNTDPGGRPTYGVVIADLLADTYPGLLDLNYGRRANRYMRAVGTPGSEGAYRDEAPTLALDGDDIRHGHYDDWVKEKIEGIEDEKPFRANGNTFDASVCDVDNDRDLDVFISTIRHAWAGESSDISRLLIQGPDGRFTCPPDMQPTRDRDPENHWNLGDLFCHLADLDQDGRVDLLISSGDYPDDQRLRVFRQTDHATFDEVTTASGIDHDGSQQLSLADVDLDGDLDILVGQTFFRYTAEQKAGRSRACASS